MAKAEARYVVDDTGRKVSVILPVFDYEELLEDLSDLAVVAERRDEPAVEHDAVKARM
jgi:hypothetical protein